MFLSEVEIAVRLVAAGILGMFFGVVAGVVLCEIGWTDPFGLIRPRR